MSTETECKYELDDMEFAEFEKIAKEVISKSDNEASIQRTFELLDDGGKGFITAEDIKQLMTRLGESMTDEEIQAVIQELTKGESQQIDLKCFKNTVSK